MYLISGSTIRKIISKTIRFDVEEIPKKVTSARFIRKRQRVLFANANLLFPETWYNIKVIRRIVTIF